MWKWTALLIAIFSSTACDTVEGDWDGAVTCDGGEMDMRLDLEADGLDDFDGTGEISAWIDGEYWEFSFDVQGEGAPRELVEDAVDLDLWFDDCREIDLGALSSCPSPSFTFWWLEDDVIDGDLDFYGVDCDFEVSR